MIVASSLVVPCELGINTNYACNCQYKGMIEKSQMKLLSTSLSSHSLQDAWSHHLLKSVQGRPCSAPIRYKVFVCQSFLTPNSGHDFSVLKTAATVLIRSYDAFRGQPLLLKMVPAVGIMAFAVWGLAPLMRLSRTLFPHKDDSSWKKRGMHYAVTSYVQPLLLWTGATLICRALDPVILPSEASQAVMQRLLNFVRSLSTVLAFAYCLSSLIQQTQKFFVETNDCSDARTMGLEFARKAVYTAVWIAAVSLFMELLGFSTQKWLTAGGLGTVLITLAGREIFTNFLSSVMIHMTRPFVLNEWIQTKIDGYEVSGTVEHVGWWSPTIIRGDDREAVHIPNHKFTVNVVRNLSQKTHWRIKTHFAISHLDVSKINNIVADMRKVLAKNPQVEQQRLHRRVFLDYIESQNQALLILVSCFVKTSRFEEYLCVKEAVLLDLLRVISHHQARLATPIRTVQKIYSDTDLENIRFSDSIFRRTNAAVNSQVLLIEPHKINSDDKNKVPSRLTLANEGKDANIEEPTILESKADSEAESTDDNQRENDSTSAPSSDDDSKAKVSTRPTYGTKNSLSNIEKQQQLNKAVSEDPTGVTSEVLSTTGASAGKPLLNFQESDTTKTNITLATPQGKLAVERSTPTSTSRPALEDNIVLGVALEGSKRTLPIEEEMVPSPIISDSKELAACRNGNGSNPVGKDKDSQISASDATN